MSHHALFERIRRTIRREDLLRSGDRVLAACSGGPDSVFLLHALDTLRPVWNLDLWVAHYNHNLRKDSEKDEAFVRDLARQLDLPFLTESGDVSSHARKRRKNLEEAARELRYGFLRRGAADIGATRIATGHTLSDQAETVLMRLLRGSGSRGLAGILPQVGGVVIRPLLGVSRREIEEYLSSSRIPYRTDPSNSDRRFLRNRIRHDLIPLLERDFAPGVEARLARLADILREEEAWGEASARTEAARFLQESDSGLDLELESMGDIHPALRRRLVRVFFERLRGDLREISFEDVEAVLNLGRDKEFQLRGGMRILNRRGRLSIRTEMVPPCPYSYSWSGEGALEVPEAELALSGAFDSLTIADRPLFDDDTMVFLDADRVRLPLIVRCRREGDRYRPMGAPGRKKLKEIMRGRGIPIEERGRRPVVESDGKIAWVQGCPVAEEFKLTDETSRVLRISVIPRIP